MEPEVVKRRGRKRKRKDGEGGDKTAKKAVLGTRSKVFIGRYVQKEFDGSGVFLGKIVSYETGLYRVDYEDGDCEDLESRELKGFLVEDNEMDNAFHKRKKALDEYIMRKYAKDETVQSGDAGNKVKTLRNDSDAVGNGVKPASADKVETVRSDSCVVDNGVELADADKVESNVLGERTGAEAEVDSETSSDFSDYGQSGELIEVDRPAVPPPQLPPSSANFGLPEEHVSYLLSVYSFLRSFSVCLFLSPFGLDEFVGALNSSVHNTLLDAIHVALIRALKSHVEILSSEGSELASKCLRSMDWSLLDSLTWPAFVVQYLTTMRYADGHEWKEFYVNVLEKDYYTLSAGRKLAVLQLLCDDASNSAELRAEIDMREASEVGPDPDGVVLNDESISRRGRPSVNPVLNDENIPRRRGRPPKASLPKDQEDVKDGNLVLNDGSIPRRRGRPPKESLSKDHEDVKDISGNHTTTVSSIPNSLVSKANVPASSSTGDYVDDDGNGDECRLCGMDGTLICCDGCPSSYHSRCIGVMKMFIPQGEWYCPECTINRIGPNVTRSTSLRGAELFGIDPYEQVFMGACDHLLVMKTSRSMELHIQYYSSVDIQKVLHALTSSAEYTTIYLEICKGILKYWEIPESIFSFPDPIGMDNNISNKFGDSSKGSGNTPDVTTARNVNGVVEYDSKDMGTACREENQKDLGFSQVTVDKSARISENSNYDNKSSTNTVSELLNTSSHKKEANLGIQSSEEKLYMGSSFKPQAYLNVYIHGDFAASAGANLAILSSEEKLASQPQASSSHRKFMSANYSLQAKAFSLAAKRFYWPNYEKKLVEVSRERCGWCLSCKSSINSKRGCLLNAAASNAIKGAAKILASLRQSKNVDGTLASIATYVMFMEESLCGLTVGPFQNASYRTDWCKQVEEAATLGEIKASLLEFERNIRDIAFSADWIRIVDDTGFENQVTQSAKNVVGSSQKRGPGRRGRKPSVMIPPEITEVEGKELSTDVAWWRGGMLSKHIFQKGMLPQMVVKHAARQGGCGKINGVQYVDGFEVPKRSRQFLWRAAVDMSKTTSQLALQVRYLDLHVRWNELVCPEQPLQEGKGPEAEASAFRNACIVDKRIMGNKISYGVVFENQKHLPSRVLKKVLEVEETGDKKEKNWFAEIHIPLYLIKEYELKTIQSTAGEQVAKLSTLPKKKLKASGKNIFSFLMQKRDNMGKCICTSCQLDVPFRIAARCNACQGYCHEHCAVGSSVQMAGSVDFLITCKQCYIEKEATLKNEIVGDSPTSPLLLQGQESQHPATVIKGGKQNGYEKPLEYLNLSSQKKLPTSNQPKKSKSGKKNGKTFDQSSSKSSKKKNNKSSKLCLGLIWKKRNPQDTGIDFRLSNLILKNNPNHHLSGPVCHLCSKPYNSGLMYIRCEKCNNWFHAESVELEESKIMELYGFKCCRCRRIRIPICPYTDPETRERLEKKKASLAKSQKQKILGSDYDSDSETNEDELMNDLELDAANTPVFESDEAVNVQEENYFYSYQTVDEQVNDQKLKVGFEPDVGPVSGMGPVPKKLPVRRHVKSEKEPDVSTELPTTYAPNPATAAGGESLAPTVEWNVSTNGFQDDMMFDYEGLNYEDMEFEPQTYFSFNELLASDDGDQDPPGDVEENMVNPSTEDCNPEQFQMGISYDQQEPMFSVESGLDMFPCRLCSQTDPCPDLFCQTCGLWVHQHCSPWDEDSSWEPENGWKCGNCREWS